MRCATSARLLGSEPSIAHAGGTRARRSADRDPRRTPLPPLEGYTFEGFRNADGSVGTRNILAITTTVQCVSGVVESRRAAHQARSCCRAIPNVDDVIGLEHTYGCGVAIDAPGAAVPIRTLRNIGRNPNFAGSTMVVSLGCEKLQPERAAAGLRRRYDLVTLQDDSHRRLPGDDRFDHDDGRGAPEAPRIGAAAKLARRRISSSACSAAAATPSPA